MSAKLNRRRFLKASAAAAGVGYFAVADVTESRAQRQDDPMRKLNCALIGVGGQGGFSLNGMSKTENIVALCDVDESNAGKNFARFPKATKYQDYRVMFDKQKDIEAVAIATPDNHHAIASIIAMKLGKHVYVEKPAAHDVWEIRQMAEAAAKHKVATQMGNQGTARNGLREGAEVIRSGAIGDVREVHIWTNRPIWPQGMTKPLAGQPVPKTLNWDLWLGPAPYRDFAPYRAADRLPGYVPFAWRGWWDFGTGAIGDMACHTMNLPYMALQLGPPSAVEAETDGALNNQSPPSGSPTPDAPVHGLTVTYQFPARGKRGPVTMKWYERRRPPAELLQGQKLGGSGMIMIGSKGSMYSPDDYGARYVLLPTKNFEGYKPPQPSIPRAPGENHHAEWLRACKGGPPAMSNLVDYAGLLTEIALLGNVAIRTGKRINWDSTNLRARNLPAADQYIRRQYRKGWTF
jgi:predicted dehydrogenase